MATPFAIDIINLNGIPVTTQDGELHVNGAPISSGETNNLSPWVIIADVDGDYTLAEEAYADGHKYLDIRYTGGGDISIANGDTLFLRGYSSIECAVGTLTMGIDSRVVGNGPDFITVSSLVSSIHANAPVSFSFSGLRVSSVDGGGDLSPVLDNSNGANGATIIAERSQIISTASVAGGAGGAGGNATPSSPISAIITLDFSGMWAGLDGSVGVNVAGEGATGTGSIIWEAGVTGTIPALTFPSGWNRSDMDSVVTLTKDIGGSGVSIDTSNQGAFPPNINLTDGSSGPPVDGQGGASGGNGGTFIAKWCELPTPNVNGGAGGTGGIGADGGLNGNTGSDGDAGTFTNAGNTNIIT